MCLAELLIPGLGFNEVETVFNKLKICKLPVTVSILLILLEASSKSLHSEVYKFIVYVWYR
jgi:hypothetical protein